MMREDPLFNLEAINELAREVLCIEAEAVRCLTKHIDSSFSKAVQIILSCHGRVVVTGMGKSGAIARKVAGTLSSIGTPALFLHSGEGIHGDLGSVTSDDVLLVISYSGETEEVGAILPALKRLGTPIITLTGNINSPLAQSAEVIIDCSVSREACPLNLAPTASTTAALAMGDALAMATMKARRFTKEDFARFHPGGALGRRLLLHVAELMRTGDQLASVNHSDTAKTAYARITSARAGAGVVINEQGALIGIVTDGDMRRAILNDASVLDGPITKVMTSSPITIGPDSLATEALRLMQERSIDDLPVIDPAGRPLGMIDVQDLLSAGIV